MRRVITDKMRNFINKFVKIINNIQISTAVGSGAIYCIAVYTAYCLRPKITPQTLIFPEGVSGRAFKEYSLHDIVC